MDSVSDINYDARPATAPPQHSRDDSQSQLNTTTTANTAQVTRVSWEGATGLGHVGHVAHTSCVFMDSTNTMWWLKVGSMGALAALCVAAGVFVFRRFRHA